MKGDAANRLSIGRNMGWDTLGTLVLNGNVGIGTTSPAGKLDTVISDTNTGFAGSAGQYALRLVNSDTTANNWVLMTFDDTANSNAPSAAIGASFTDQTNNYADIGFATRSVAGWSEKMRILSTGNVGIGTTVPASKLDVRGQTITNSIAIADNTGTIYQDNWVGMASNFDGLNNKWLHIGGITDNTNGTGAKRRIALFADRTYLSGNVGIGTTSPGGLLDVNGSVGAVRVSSDGAHMQFTRGAANYIHATSAGGEFIFTVNGNADSSGAMVIKSSGNVGIGTTAPVTKTEIRKPYTWSGGLTSEGDPLTFGVYKADPTLLLSTTNSRTTDYGGSIGFSNADGFVLGAIRGAATNSTGTEYGGYLSFHTTQSGSGGPYEKMRITQEGNVGIGTTSPGLKLDVVGTAQVIGSGDVGNGWYTTNTSKTGNSQAYRWVWWNMTGGYGDKFGLYAYSRDNACAGGLCANPFSIYDDGRAHFSGNVGIGTASPGSSLQVVGGIWTRGGAPGANGVNNNGYAFWGNGGDTDSGMFSSADGQIEFYSNSAEVVRIAAGGNVGIGTTSPGAPLAIAHEAPYSFPNPGTSAKGAINIRTTTSNRQTGITFSQSGVDNAQAGLYVHQDNSAGTHMYLATTDSYATGPQARVTILNNGNVGIGTASPTETLTVSNGSLLLDQTGATVPKIKMNGAPAQIIPSVRVYNPDNSTNDYLWWTARDGTAFVVESGAVDGDSGTELFRISEAGNVGIGTTSPGSKLDVVGAGTNIGWGGATVTNLLTPDQGGSIELGGTNSVANPIMNGVPYIDFHFGTGTIQDYNVRITNDADYRLSVIAPTTYLSGNVGIGTTSPQHKLQLGNAAYLAFPSIAGSYVPTSWARGNSGGIIFSSSANADGSGWSYGSRVVSHDFGDGLALSFDVNNLGWTNDVLVISGRNGKVGNVGIDTTGPADSLHVRSSNYRITAEHDGNANGTNSVWGQYSSIGQTHNPGFTWAGGTLGLTNVMNSDYAFFDMTGTNDDSNAIINWGDDNDLLFAFNGTERTRITGGGNVGIGTTAPSAPLHVNGAVIIGREGLAGTYNSAQVQGIWSIGNAYRIDTTSNTFGNAYGVVYSHTNAGTGAANQPIAGWGHQILFTSNGTANAAVSLTSGSGYFAGNVGIGITTPAALLAIAASENFAEVARFGTSAGIFGAVHGSTYIGLTPWIPLSGYTYFHAWIGFQKGNVGSHPQLSPSIKDVGTFRALVRPPTSAH